MRSAADRARIAAEWLAQGVAIALLAWALLSALERPSTAASPEVAPIDSVRLAAWTAGLPPARIHARLDSLPSPLERDWLSAFAHSGSEVSWGGDALVPVAVAVEPIASPAGSERVRVAALSRTSIVVRDAAGRLDSARVDAGGIVLASRTLVGPVEAWTMAGAAAAAPRERAEIRPVVVLGRAGWESKFVIAALEEQGWPVVARLSVAPGADVEQGRVGVPDTSRHSAVIALDATAAAGSMGASIVRFARSGGGVVLAGDAAVAGAFRAIAPGGSGEYLPAGSAALPDSAPRRGLSLHPVVLRAVDAVVLERRGPRPAIAARRVMLGRVMQIGYDDTWRWRMGGGDDAPRAHGEWWSAVVSAVAYAPRMPLDPRVAMPEGVDLATPEGADIATSPSPSDAVLDPAPYAHLIGALGAAEAEPAVTARARGASRRWMLPAIAVLLLLAWGSRRLRGAP